MTNCRRLAISISENTTCRIISIMDSLQSTLSNSISAETTNRTNADADLQNQINNKISWWSSGNCVRLNNLQICFGVSAGVSNITVNFNQPFKTAPSVLTTVLNSSDTGGSSVVSKVATVSTTGFIYNCRTGGGSAASATYTTMWIAVGWS